MSVNALALSHENLRLLSCHGQINRKSRPPFAIKFFPSRASDIIASGRRDPDGIIGSQQASMR
jgi:hypothetical protein